jgi:hypothetical protein
MLIKSLRLPTDKVMGVNRVTGLVGADGGGCAYASEGGPGVAAILYLTIGRLDRGDFGFVDLLLTPKDVEELQALLVTIKAKIDTKSVSEPTAYDMKTVIR